MSDDAVEVRFDLKLPDRPADSVYCLDFFFFFSVNQVVEIQCYSFFLYATSFALFVFRNILRVRKYVTRLHT